MIDWQKTASSVIGEDAMYHMWVLSSRLPFTLAYRRAA